MSSHQVRLREITSVFFPLLYLSILCAYAAAGRRTNHATNQLESVNTTTTSSAHQWSVSLPVQQSSVLILASCRIAYFRFLIVCQCATRVRTDWEAFPYSMCFLACTVLLVGDIWSYDRALSSHQVGNEVLQALSPSVSQWVNTIMGIMVTDSSLQGRRNKEE